MQSEQAYIYGSRDTWAWGTTRTVFPAPCSELCSIARWHRKQQLKQQGSHVSGPDVQTRHPTLDQCWQQVDQMTHQTLNRLAMIHRTLNPGGHVSLHAGPIYAPGSRDIQAAEPIVKGGLLPEDKEATAQNREQPSLLFMPCDTCIHQRLRTACGIAHGARGIRAQTTALSCGGVFIPANVWYRVAQLKHQQCMTRTCRLVLRCRSQQSPENSEGRAVRMSVEERGRTWRGSMLRAPVSTQWTCNVQYNHMSLISNCTIWHGPTHTIHAGAVAGDAMRAVAQYCRSDARMGVRTR